MNTRYLRTIAVLSTLVLAFGAVAALAGGPLLIFDPATQTPYAWPGVVPVYTDNDPFFSVAGPVTNADADARVDFGFTQWENVPTATMTHVMAGDFASIALPDINLGNVGLVLNTDNGGGYHVIYDHDGSIIAALAGPGVLGFSSPEYANIGTNQITESYAVMNGATVDPGDAGGIWWQGVFTHEFGHGINLAHTQTNGAIGFFGDTRGPGGCAPIPGSLFISDLETMYPFLDPGIGGSGIEQGTVELIDDVSSLSNVYPAAGWPASHGTIEGTIYASNGVDQVTGVNVVARNIADPFSDCNSALSGDFTQGALGPDGRFTLNGLTPGADYVLYIEGIIAGGFSTAPANPFPGPEEYYNGANESGDGAADDKCDFTLITPAAGVPVTADIIFNLEIILGDDDFIEVPLPFTFPMCDKDYDSVFIGSNGFITFGAGNTDFSESVGDLQAGPRRIAPYWVDLNPTQGGSITAEDVAGDFVITWEAVPEFFATGANTFSVTLRSDGTWRCDYGDMTAADGLVGYSPGSGLGLDVGPIDVSAEAQPIAGGPQEMVYEQFIGTNDLANSGQEWAGCPYFEIIIANALEGVCYGSLGAGGGGNLITINPNTGAGTLIGPVGTDGVPGLAINSAGEMYGTDRISGDLYRIDAATGQGYFVASTGISFLDGIAFDENDVLYGVAYDPPFFTLLTIDVNNGNVTPIGPVGEIIVGLAFDPTNGDLYGSVGGFQPNTPDAIYRIDKNSGASVLVGQTGISGGAVPDIKFDCEGNLYASKNIGGEGHFVAIDKTTGVGTMIGSTGFNALSGLAMYCPPVVKVEMDIKPGSCPNPFNLNLFTFAEGANPKKGGVLPVAIPGTNDLDVSLIDPATIRLEGVAPVMTGMGVKIDDVTQPDGDLTCACNNLGDDGIDDLKMRFRAQDIAAQIMAGAQGDEMVLTMTFELYDGTQYEATDCITLVGGGNDNDLPAGTLPSDLAVGAYPNPFNPTTIVRYELPEDGFVRLDVYNVAGQHVTRLVNEHKEAGVFQVRWSADALPSGIYFTRLTVNGNTQTKKVVLLK